MTLKGFVEGCGWVLVAFAGLGIAGVLMSEVYAYLGRRKADRQPNAKALRLAEVCQLSPKQRQIEWLERHYGDLTPHEETRARGRAKYTLMLAVRRFGGHMKRTI